MVHQRLQRDDVSEKEIREAFETGEEVSASIGRMVTSVDARLRTATARVDDQPYLSSFRT